MLTFSKKQTATQQATSAKSPKSNRLFVDLCHDEHSIFQLQRTIGNQATLRLLQNETENIDPNSGSRTSTGIFQDFCRIPVYLETRNNNQPKFKFNALKNRHKQEADRLAAQVLRREIPEEAEDQKVEIQTKSTIETASERKREVNEVLEKQLSRTKDCRNRISDQACAYVGSRMQNAFCKVQVNTNNKAAQMNSNQSVRAFAFGKDIYIGAGQHYPDSYEGKRLQVHELSPAAKRKNTSSIQRAPITISGRQFMEGDVVLSQTSSRDIRSHGNLLPGADQGHIAVTSNRKLAYEMSYTNPEDPFRWNILKNIIDNHHVQIFAVGATEAFNAKEVTINQGTRTQVIRQINLMMFMGSGITMPTESQQLSINPQATRMVASTGNTYHQVYYETGAGGRGMLGSNSLSHELFGHLWLALQGVQYQHGRSLAGTTNINDPLGRQFTGSVNDYISNFAGASNISVIQSPTFNVSSQHLLSTIQWIEQHGENHISTQGNGSIDADLDLKWQALSNNYDILRINSHTGVRVSQNLSLTASSVVTRMVTWINGLPADKKSAFRNILRTITQTFGANRRTGLSNVVFPRI